MTTESQCLPGVLLIGDSIRMGYCATVERELADVAKVVYPTENCRHSQYVLTGLEGWQKLCPDAAFVHVNFGQWDVARFADSGERLTSPAEYGRNAQIIFHVLRKMFPNAKFAFATTTPMRPGEYVGPHPRSDADVDEYNAIAVPIARECGFEIDDLNAFAQGWPADAYADSCHYTPASFERIGKAVAAFIRERL